MCKTRGLSTAIFNVSLFSALWRKLYASSLTHTLILERYLMFFFFFFVKASGRSHSLFVLEAVRGQAASYVMSAHTHAHTHTHTHTHRQPNPVSAVFRPTTTVPF